MKNTLGSIRLVSGNFLLVALLVTGLATTAYGQAPGAPTPTGLDKYLVFMANGAYFPEPGNFWEFYLVQRVLLGRSDAEIEQVRDDAIAYYLQRFGLDVNDPANDGRISLDPAYLRPRRWYRAYTVSGENVPADGWPVHDSGWILMVTDPAGVTLGGDFAGLVVPEGTAFSYGDYFIDNRASGGVPIVIHYEAYEPVIRDQFGVVSFRCVLSHPVYGMGVAQGSQYAIQLPDGRQQLSIRNVLTFPPLIPPAPLPQP